MKRNPGIRDLITYKEYLEAITITKKSLRVGKNYSPYLINKSLMSMFIKTNNLEGIRFLNRLNMFMGGKSKVVARFLPTVVKNTYGY